MVQSSAQPLNLEAFLELPEIKPAGEYIDGRIVQKPMPRGKHSAIQTELSSFINTALRPPRIARAFSELRCTFGGRSTVPDISVFTWDRIAREENGEVANTFEAAPDWIIEILSPDQSQTRVTKNILHSLSHGTQMGWLIDPAEQTVFVYLPKQEIQVFDALTVQLPTPTFSRLELDLDTLFGWLSE